MVSELSQTSQSNPRGYLRDPALDIANAGNFEARMLAAADNTINVLNGMSVRPQGIIVWDLEGQEFTQPFTYVGYPSKLPDLAPEMDRVADVFFSKIKAAGYRIGMTIRPQHFGTGTTLPPTCVSDTNYNLWDKFILLTATYPHRGYVCSSNNVWQVSTTPNGPGGQTSTQDYNAALSLLQQKISYAHSRWGATLFYIDSSVWEGGAPIDPSILRVLAAQFPDCLFIPENTTQGHFSSTAPYNWNGGSWNRAADARLLYPDAFQVFNIANVDLSVDQGRLVQMIQAGDILLFPGWWVAPEVIAIQQLYAAAGVH
jgi:hypothetical protein